MSYARKNTKNVLGSIIGVVIVAAIAVWQFYLFVTFENSPGNEAGAAGTHHLWWAIAMAGLACGAGFLVFSVFVQHDDDDDLHITSAPRARI